MSVFVTFTATVRQFDITVYKLCICNATILDDIIYNDTCKNLHI